MIVRNVGQTESTTLSGQTSKSLIVQVSKNGSWPEKRLVSLDNWINYSRIIVPANPINLSTPRFFSPQWTQETKKLSTHETRYNVVLKVSKSFWKVHHCKIASHRIFHHWEVITVKFSWINSIAGLQYAYLNSDENKKSEDASNDLAKASRSEITLGKNQN